MGWVALRHAETGGTTRAPDSPDVIAAHEAKGWRVVSDEPEGGVFVPASTDAPEGEPWVDMVHPDLPLAVQRVPNDPAAIAGQREAGWDLPKPPAKPPAKDKQATPAAETKE